VTEAVKRRAESASRPRFRSCASGQEAVSVLEEVNARPASSDDAADPGSPCCLESRRARPEPYIRCLVVVAAWRLVKPGPSGHGSDGRTSFGRRRSGLRSGRGRGNVARAPFTPRRGVRRKIGLQPGTEQWLRKDCGPAVIAFLGRMDIGLDVKSAELGFDRAGHDRSPLPQPQEPAGVRTGAANPVARHPASSPHRRRRRASGGGPENA
jgi:hypothetical protein